MIFNLINDDGVNDNNNKNIISIILVIIIVTAFAINTAMIVAMVNNTSKYGNTKCDMIKLIVRIVTF